MPIVTLPQRGDPSTSSGAPQTAPGERQRSPVHDRARGAWNELYGGYAAQARAWRFVAFGCIAITMAAIAGNVYLATRNHTVVYFAELDKFGYPVIRTEAEQSSPLSPAEIAEHLKTWIFDVRTQSADASTEGALIKAAYAMTAQPSAAKNKLDDWFLHPDYIFDRIKKESVDTQVNEVLQIPNAKGAWRIAWTETGRSIDGKSVSVHNFAAIVSVRIAPPKTRAQFFANPTGFLVTDVNWR
jgi:type IV secretory pathway TrbF-like protein